MSTLLAGPKKPIDYWGFSYGTTVGTYLTAMFPKRVGNVAIDAVMAVETWYGKLHYETSAEQYLVGFEDSWEYFVSECAKVGLQVASARTCSDTARAPVSTTRPARSAAHSPPRSSRPPHRSAPPSTPSSSHCGTARSP